ncbi:MAG: hypothetical protein ABSH41_09070 [Syntrophobacteraceae bacterium]|jgi:hypothetical protein
MGGAKRNPSILFETKNAEIAEKNAEKEILSVVINPVAPSLRLCGELCIILSLVFYPAALLLRGA